MNKEELKQLTNSICDVIVRQNQSDKKEVSPHLFEIKGRLGTIDEKLEKISSHLEILNGKVAKHVTDIALIHEREKDYATKGQVDVLNERGKPISKIVWGVAMVGLSALSGYIWSNR